MKCLLSTQITKGAASSPYLGRVIALPTTRAIHSWRLIYAEMCTHSIMMQDIVAFTASGDFCLVATPRASFLGPYVESSARCGRLACDAPSSYHCGCSCCSCPPLSNFLSPILVRSSWTVWQWQRRLSATIICIFLARRSTHITNGTAWCNIICILLTRPAQHANHR